MPDDVTASGDAGRQDIADFFKEVMQQNSEHATRCHEFMKELSGSQESGAAVT